ncbi:unnamed protein product, partial [Iphiclides podalirius]
MLSLTLILLGATSILAAPSAVVDLYEVNEIPALADNGRPSSFIENAFDVATDGGETNIYILSLRQVLQDLANLSDTNSQALAVSQALAILGELAYGSPGDSCSAASLINAYVNGNKAEIRNALVNYAQNLAGNIDAIVQLIQNPSSIRYSTGRRGNCAGGGRSYQFEAAWDAVLTSVNPYQASLVNEEYCASKRLYNAFNVRSNNVGAAATASSLPPVVQIVQSAYGALSNLLRSVAYNGNVAGAGAAAKAGLIQALSSVNI